MSFGYIGQIIATLILISTPPIYFYYYIIIIIYFVKTKDAAGLHLQTDTYREEAFGLALLAFGTFLLHIIPF